ERACVLCEKGVIEVTDLPAHKLTPEANSAAPTTASTPLFAAAAIDPTAPLPLKEFTHQQEVAYVRQILRTVNDNRTQAASLLKVSPTTLYRLLNRTGAGRVDGDDESPAEQPEAKGALQSAK